MTKLKILIVDDEEDYCFILKTFFLQRNCDVCIIHTLREGLDMLKQFQPDVLFLDNNLPDGNGWEAVDYITNMMPLLNIYLVSAHKHKSDVRNNSPLITTWEKPISLALLTSVVQKHHPNYTEQREIK